MIKEDLSILNNRITLRLFDKLPDVAAVIEDINSLSINTISNKNCSVHSDFYRNIKNIDQIEYSIKKIKNFFVEKTKNLGESNIVLRMDDASFNAISYYYNTNINEYGTKINLWVPDLPLNDRESKKYLEHIFGLLMLGTPLYNGIFTNKLTFSENSILQSIRRLMNLNTVNQFPNSFNYILPTEYFSPTNVRLFLKYTESTFFNNIKNYFKYKYKIILNDNIYDVNSVFKNIKPQDYLELNKNINKIIIKNKRLMSINEKETGYILIFLYLAGIYRMNNLNFDKECVDNFVSNLIFLWEKYANI